MIGDIDSSRRSLDSSFNTLQNLTTQVNYKCEENSSTTQELSAFMQENAATAREISESLNLMRDNAQNIDYMASSGTELSDAARKRAEAMKQETVVAVKATTDIYNNVKSKAVVAIEDAKNVDKINQLTETIKEISTQTGLLALNASIEAARAGEVGKGFAVVASEISNLAAQTANAVENIEDTVTKVVSAVDNMQDCLSETTSFIGNTVLKDYEKFKNVSEQYDKDATEFKTNMDTIKEGANSLNHQVNDLSDTIKSMADGIDSSATGISNMASNTTNISGEASNTFNQVLQCKTYMKTLDDITDKFTLE